MFHDQASQEQKVYNFLPSQTESKIKIKKIKLKSIPDEGDYSVSNFTR